MEQLQNSVDHKETLNIYLKLDMTESTYFLPQCLVKPEIKFQLKLLHWTSPKLKPFVL